MTSEINYKQIALDYARRELRWRQAFVVVAELAHVEHTQVDVSTWRTCEHKLCVKARQLASTLVIDALESDHLELEAL